ncbi:MAG: transcription repressor NadR [Muribaculaceae bacterium]|nr:transcription repressor NadR [Muribaculaceae bacterium]
MEGDKRRKKIMELLQQEYRPISGTELARKLGVSRQVIVQDIALLRASCEEILSTNKGYLLLQDTGVLPYRKTVKVKHENEEIEQELNLIVDNGADVLDVSVEHPIYGRIMADLIIHNRADVQEFVQKVKENETKPLTILTQGVHFHTITAPREEILNEVEKQLKLAGFLLED